jgi:hypothetical protein
MAFKDCIVNGTKDGDLTPEQAKAAQQMHEQRLNLHKGQMSDDAAEVLATKETLQVLEDQLSHKRRNLLLSKEKQSDVARKLFGQDGYRGGDQPGLGAQALIDGDRYSTYSNVQGRQKAIFGQYLSYMDRALGQFRRRGITGNMANIDTLYDVVKELWGADTKNVAAKEIAEAWTKTAELARQRFNKAGGAIVKLATWRLPQKHNGVAVRKAGRDMWTKFVTPLLDLNLMKNEKTGLSFTKEELSLALNEVYDTIGTDGYSKVKPSGQLYTNVRSVSNRYLDHRFLVFKDADSWIEYQKAFGDPDVFNTMISYLHKMSHDTASMEILGPNPNATMNFIRQSVIKDAAQKDLANTTGKRASLLSKTFVAKAEKEINFMDEMWQVFNGSAYASAADVVPRTFQGVRNLINSAFLGGTAITSLSDLSYQRITAKANGIPTNRVMRRILKNLSPLGVEERGRLASRMGLIAESWIGLAQAQARFAGDITGPEMTQRISDIVMRASGLSAWTQAGRFAFGMEFMGYISDNVGKSFGELDKALQKGLKRYGFNEAQWDMLRKSDLYEFEGSKFLRPEEIRLAAHLGEDEAQELSTRFLEMIQTETEFAVPTTTVRGKATLIGASQAGTILGEISRSFAMYKNFAVTLYHTHIMRALSEATLKGKAGSVGDLVVSSMLMGGLVLQLQEMRKGRDPRAMDTKEFWGAALMQGGGLGIYGDLLFSNINRYGAGLEDTLAGPVINLINNLKNLTIGNISQASKGEDTNVASETLKMIQTYFPGSTIWYINLMMQRELWERMQLWIDPNYMDRLNRMQNKYLNETGQEFWWKPGYTAPDRAPEISSETLLTQ